MKLTIRFKFFALVAIHTALVFGLIGILLLGFNLHEQHEHPELRGEEFEESLIVAGSMMGLFPITLISAWYVSRRLLRPWNALSIKAEKISNGALDDRIEIKNPDDEIGRLANTLNQAFDRYQQLLIRMQRFNYDASHQLRNPLAAIRTNGEVCLKRARTVEEYQEVISQILDETNRLSRTIEQLLLLARCTTDGISDQMKEFDLFPLIDEIANEGNIIGELRSIDIQVIRSLSEQERVKGVRELIREALSNLLDNALRYAPDQSTIEIHVKKIDTKTVKLMICDKGVGLTAEQKSSVFHPFERNRLDRGGTGLGLAIVADICRAHEASFGVNDNQPSGCCFWINIKSADA